MIGKWQKRLSRKGRERLLFKVSDFASEYGFKIFGLKELSFEKIVTDSREAGPKKAFAALKGRKNDGHDFIEEAYASGSRVFFVDSKRIEEIRKKYINWNTNASFLYIEGMDSQESLLSAAKNKAKGIQGEIIGITGSSGKTTVKEMLYCLLGLKFEVFKVRKSFNTPLGLSVEILNARPNADFYLFEYGIRKENDMDELLEIVKPTKAIITNIGFAHVGILGSREAIFKEKIKLAKAESVREVYLNSEDDFFEKSIRELKGYSCRIYTCGRNDSDDLRYQVLSVDEAGYPEVRFFFRKMTFDFKLPVPGLHNVSNLAIASLLALKNGLGKEEFLEAVAEVRLPKMRLEVLRKEGVIFINDAYNSNPASLRSALEFLFTLSKEADKKKIAVLGDMLELGDYSEEMHEEAGRQAKVLGVDAVIYIGDFFESFKKGFGEERIFRASNCKEAADILKGMLTEKTVVLIKASRALGLERVLEYV
ncbi:MAG: UDP-N-acetylmuramoyl-tripeptide--D-alanyl-D-alanine ligase [Actinobacteria bacterium]|nr:UDP-N-acetylmuramoyl-tripeptide--D-alanyl-D-alanine ligase [Actinomycetota bacterium]